MIHFINALLNDSKAQNLELNHFAPQSWYLFNHYRMLFDYDFIMYYFRMI